MTDTLNLAEAAEFLKLGYVATKELFDSGVLPGVSLNQKHTVFLRTDLETWLRETARRQAAERRALPIRNPPAPQKRTRTSLPDLAQYEKQ